MCPPLNHVLGLFCMYLVLDLIRKHSIIIYLNSLVKTFTNVYILDCIFAILGKIVCEMIWIIHNLCFNNLIEVIIIVFMKSLNKDLHFFQEEIEI